MHPHRLYYLLLRHPTPRSFLLRESLQSGSPASFLDKHDAHPALEVENRVRDLSVALSGVLPCGGVDEVWTVPEKHGEYDVDVYWACGLGGDEGVCGGLSKGAEVVEGGGREREN